VPFNDIKHSKCSVSVRVYYALLENICFSENSVNGERV